MMKEEDRCEVGSFGAGDKSEGEAAWTADASDRVEKCGLRGKCDEEMKAMSGGVFLLRPPLFLPLPWRGGTLTKELKKTLWAQL